MAGTAVSTEIRSASMARSHSPASNAGISTVVPAARHVGSHWTRLPITWKSGAGTRLRMSGSGSADSSSARRAAEVPVGQDELERLVRAVQDRAAAVVDGDVAERGVVGVEPDRAHRVGPVRVIG